MKLEIDTANSYGDIFVEYVKLEQDEKTVGFGRSNKSILQTTEERAYSHDFSSDKSYIESGCMLDFEVVTPEPYISVEVSSKEIGDKKESEWAGWKFESTNQFENWARKNNIQLKSN